MSGWGMACSSKVSHFLQESGRRHASMTGTRSRWDEGGEAGGGGGTLRVSPTPACCRVRASCGWDTQATMAFSAHFRTPCRTPSEEPPPCAPFPCRNCRHPFYRTQASLVNTVASRGH